MLPEMSFLSVVSISHVTGTIALTRCDNVYILRKCKDNFSCPQSCSLLRSNIYQLLHAKWILLVCLLFVFNHDLFPKYFLQFTSLGCSSFILHPILSESRLLMVTCFGQRSLPWMVLGIYFRDL